MEIQEIINRNYAAQLRRGTITEETRLYEFINKLQEEKEELYESWANSSIHNYFNPSELADVILVCFAMAKHFNVDILTELEKKTLYNEIRED
jgi:hypothetical protein